MIWTGFGRTATAVAAAAIALAGCAATETGGSPAKPRSAEGLRYLGQPLLQDIYIADPSAHVFDGRIYVYGSHDVDGTTPEDDLGSHFEMRDYRVVSFDRIGGKPTVHPVALDVRDVPWAEKQMWAPDAARKNGRYFLYFPAKDREGVFRIGVATSDRPEGPFKAEPKPIEGAYSIDPAVFTDGDGASYMVFGGIWGGQLQRWASGRFDPNGSNTDLGRNDAPALTPRIARLRDDMLEFAETPRPLAIVDEAGKPLLAGDHDRRFFEAAWIHKHDGLYYLTYSTGDTHFIAYATSRSPYGPFTYRGRVLAPVQGWTTHHSIVEVGGRWYLFYHDTQISGRTHLRNMKVTPLVHEPDGTIRTIDPFVR
ncbi:glycoside hydrolase family 43 protein [Sphingomonas parva]|nr:glycoside hydrolase family 43 protein [Sphingomonas parva]